MVSPSKSQSFESVLKLTYNDKKDTQSDLVEEREGDKIGTRWSLNGDTISMFVDMEMGDDATSEERLIVGLESVLAVEVIG